METTTIERIKALVEEYNEKLLPHGVKCEVHRRYFTSKVISYPSTHLIDKIARSFLDKRENAEFHNAPNRFKTAEITLKPLQKGVVAPTDCKRYVFVVEAIERDSLGKEPKHILRKEEKVLREVEKRLKKLLQRASKASDASWCKNNFADKVRYALSAKYV